ncbi:MAG TPA: hypothetical protein PLS28_03815, partial [Clostridiales bacterium]|nr:hypothetical protein [Clostridiales bacterium]
MMKISIVLYMDRLAETARALHALKKNSCFSSTQILVADPFCTSESETLLQEFPFAEVLPLKDASMAEAYQEGLSKAKGNFVNFTLSSSVLDRGALDAVQLVSARKDENGKPVHLIALHVKGINMVNNAGSKVHYKMQAKRRGFSNIRFEPMQMNLVLQSYFIETDLAKSISFDPSLLSTAINAYLLQILAEEYVVYAIKERSYTYYALLENSAGACEIARNKDWYEDSVRKFYTPFVTRLEEANGTVPLFLQIATLYFVWAKYNCNYFDRDREVLNREEANAFFEATYEFMSHINNNVIFQDIPCNYTMARQLKMFFYKGKYKFLGLKPCGAKVISGGGFDHQLVLDDDAFQHYDANSLGHVEGRADALDLSTMGLIQNQHVEIMVLDYIDGKLEIDYEITDYLLETSDYEIFLKVGEDRYFEPTPTEVYSLVKYFGHTIDRRSTFHASVPVGELLDKGLSFGFRLNGEEYLMNLRFPKMAAKLVNSNASYCMLEKDLYLSVKGQSLVVKKLKKGQRFFLEAKFFAYRLVATPVAEHLV